MNQYTLTEENLVKSPKLSSSEIKLFKKINLKKSFSGSTLQFNKKKLEIFFQNLMKCKIYENH